MDMVCLDGAETKRPIGMAKGCSGFPNPQRLKYVSSLVKQFCISIYERRDELAGRDQGVFGQKPRETSIALGKMRV